MANMYVPQKKEINIHTVWGVNPHTVVNPKYRLVAGIIIYFSFFFFKSFENVAYFFPQWWNPRSFMSSSLLYTL